MPREKHVPERGSGYLDLVRVLRAEAAAIRDDLERVIGMFRTPEDHKAANVKVHFLKSFAGRRPGWKERAARFERLMAEAELMALTLEV